MSSSAPHPAHIIEVQFTTFQAIFTVVLVASALVGVAFLLVMWNSDRKHH